MRTCMDSALSGLVAIASGCGGDESSVAIRLIDVNTVAGSVAFDIRSAVVTIDQIYLQGQDRRVVLSETPITADFLATPALVSGMTVPEGTYAQLRFVISGAYIMVPRDDGEATYATPGYAAVPST